MKSALSALFVASAIVALPLSSRALLVTNTFDDYSDNGSGTAITNGYGGLLWSNFFVLNTTLNGSNGFLQATVSAPNVAYTGAGAAEIDFNVPGMDFKPLGAYFTSPNSPSSLVNMTGFWHGQEVEGDDFTITSNAPFFFNWFGATLPLDRVVLKFEGAVPGPLVMDNFTYSITPSPVPEPSAMLLCAIGGLALCGALVAKR